MYSFSSVNSLNNSNNSNNFNNNNISCTSPMNANINVNTYASPTVNKKSLAKISKRKYNDAFTYYQQGIYPAYKKIVAIGDIHGDYMAFITVLRKSKLIDNTLSWVGGDVHVVQIGDILDRKPRDDGNDENDEDSEFKIISLILKLQIESFQAGGGFHCVIGNHELMNILSMFTYVSPMGFEHFGGEENRKKFFEIGNSFSRYLACSFNPIVKIGKIIFCHGGITPNIARKYKIEDINLIMRDTLYGNKRHLSQHYFKELFLNENSILWNRTFSNNDDISPYYENHIQNQINNVLELWNGDHIVCGHTPQNNGVNKKFNGKLLCIDVGLSRAFGINNSNRIHYLIIEEDDKKRKIILK